MEGLRKLGQVQKLLELMQSHGIINSSNNNTTNADSERFLANLFLLMIQPCGELDMNTKCQLVSEHLPKISAAFLEEALQCLSEEGHEPAETVFPLYCDKKAGLGSLQSDSDNMGMVGLDAMQRANSTLEDFCRSYFMFHEMDVNRPQSIFRYLPILSFTEGYIYQLDSLNEKSLQLPISGVPDSELDLEANQSWIVQFMKLFGTEPFRPLLVLLEQHGLLTGRIREEFRFGEEYWALERKLCSALMSKQEVSVEDVMRAIHLKSFDYRVLNLLLYQLRGEELLQRLMNCTWNFYQFQNSLLRYLMTCLTMRRMSWRTISIFCACLSEYMGLPQHQPCWQDLYLKPKRSMIYYWNPWIPKFP